MIIYGWKRYAQVLAVLTLVCQQCHLPAEHVLRRLTTKFTLFFIPLFPISRKHILTCTSCEGENKVSREQAEQLMAGAGQPGPVPQSQQPQQFAGPPTPPPQPAYGQPQQYGPPPQQGQPRQYGQPPQQYGPPQPGYGQPQYPPMPGGQPPYGYPQGPPIRQPHPGQPQPAGYQAQPYQQNGGYPQQNGGGYPYPPGR